MIMIIGFFLKMIFLLVLEKGFFFYYCDIFEVCFMIFLNFVLDLICRYKFI